MTNALINSHNHCNEWRPCLDGVDDKFLICLPEEVRSTTLQRWKNYENQVVIKTDSHYYKIYQVPDDGAPCRRRGCAGAGDPCRDGLQMQDGG